MEQKEARELLWKEWEYRHGVFWKSLNIWGLAVVTASVFPYANYELVRQLRWSVLIFPVIAALVAAFGAWHLYAEYARLRSVGKKYYELLGEFNHQDGEGFNFWSKARIGVVVPLVFVLVVPVSAISMCILTLQILSI